MHPRVDVSQPDKVTYITILLTLSEPQRILEQKQKLIDNFKIGDILVTDPVHRLMYVSCDNAYKL